MHRWQQGSLIAVHSEELEAADAGVRAHARVLRQARRDDDSPAGGPGPGDGREDGPLEFVEHLQIVRQLHDSTHMTSQ